MKRLLIILCLWLNPIQTMNAKEDDELNNHLPVIEDFEHDAYSSHELLHTYQRLLDSPPLYPESMMDTLSAPSKPTYVINLRPEQESPIPAALAYATSAQSPVAKKLEEPTQSLEPFISCYSSSRDLYFDLKNFRCKACGQQCADRSALNIHCVRNHGVKKFSCPDCSRTFSYEGDLTQHRKKVHLIHHHASATPPVRTPHTRTRKTFRCKVCPDVFDSLDSLHNHYTQTHAATALHVCNVCSEPYLSEKQLLTHNHKKHTTSD